jgi:DNA-binding response OmpR family regulator
VDKTANILIVEDDAYIVFALKASLKKAGHKICRVVATGEAALSSLDQDHPNLLLIDIHLAGKLDGIEVARRVRAQYGIPIIFITGYEDNESKMQANAVNPVAYLVKPFSVSDLDAAIDLAFA